MEYHFNLKKLINLVNMVIVIQHSFIKVLTVANFGCLSHSLDLPLIDIAM